MSLHAGDHNSKVVTCTRQVHGYFFNEWQFYCFWNTNARVFCHVNRPLYALGSGRWRQTPSLTTPLLHIVLGINICRGWETRREVCLTSGFPASLLPSPNHYLPSPSLLLLLPFTLFHLYITALCSAYIALSHSVTATHPLPSHPIWQYYFVIVYYLFFTPILPLLCCLFPVFTLEIIPLIPT